MTLNGVVVPIRHVYAAAEPGLFDKRVEDVHVVLSDQPLSDAVRGDTFQMMRIARRDRVHILEIIIDASGNAMSGSIVRFSAPIPRPPTAAELDAQLASPPGVAAAQYVAAVRAGQLSTLLAILTEDAGADYRGPNGPMRLDQLRNEMPADSRVVSLEPQTDGSILANIEGHDGGIVIAYQLRMVLDSGRWKVGT